MKPISDHYPELFQKLIEGKLSPQELETLVAWMGSEEPDPLVADLIKRQLAQDVPVAAIDPDLISRLESRLPAILHPPQQAPRIHIWQRGWFRYAAVLLILFSGVGIYALLRQPQPAIRPVQPAPIAATSDIDPGRDGAILTLADGRTLVLDSLGNGVVADERGTKVLLKDGQLQYDGQDLSGADKIVFNTMTTPKGRKFQLALPDGTKVWLNAASSLRYPIAFTGAERAVEVTGEAYFEVAKDPAKPFHVKANHQVDVEVLGTHFNINAYENEQRISTTLLEGSVCVRADKNKAVIRPGEQALVSQAFSPLVKVKDHVDVDKVMAWKNGIFDFDDASLEDVMRQLERWYDIDVAYEKGIPNIEFVGKMDRSMSLAHVLRGLELSKVHFRMDGRKLTVLP